MKNNLNSIFRLCESKTSYRCQCISNTYCTSFIVLFKNIYLKITFILIMSLPLTKQNWKIWNLIFLIYVSCKHNTFNIIEVLILFFFFYTLTYSFWQQFYITLRLAVCFPLFFSQQLLCVTLCITQGLMVGWKLETLFARIC